MTVRDIEDLRIYGQSIEAAEAVSAILRRSSFNCDPGLREQLAKASGGIPALIAEGFGQSSDGHFAHYLSLARGSANETRAHLAIARGRGHITALETAEVSARFIEIGKGLTRLIQHLIRENRSRRGIGP